MEFNINYEVLLADNNKFISAYIAKIQAVEYYTYGSFLKSLTNEDSVELGNILSVALTHLRWLSEITDPDEIVPEYNAGEAALEFASKLLCVAITGDGGTIDEDQFHKSINFLVLGSIMNVMHRDGELVLEYDKLSILCENDDEIIMRKN